MEWGDSVRSDVVFLSFQHFSKLFPVIFAFNRFIWEYAPDLFCAMLRLCVKVNAKPTLDSGEYAQLKEM